MYLAIELKVHVDHSAKPTCSYHDVNMMIHIIQDDFHDYIQNGNRSSYPPEKSHTLYRFEAWKELPGHVWIIVWSNHAHVVIFTCYTRWHLEWHPKWALK